MISGMEYRKTTVFPHSTCLQIIQTTHPAELASLQRNQDANSGHLCSAYPAVAKVGDVENIVNSQDTRSCGAILPRRLSEETTVRLPRRKTVEKLLTVSLGTLIQ